MIRKYIQNSFSVIKGCLLLILSAKYNLDIVDGMVVALLGILPPVRY